MDEVQIVETENDYDIYHYIRSSDTAANITGESWTSITSGSVPSITEARYIQYRTVISSNTYFSSLGQIDKVIINYHSTSGETYLSSMSYDGRIWNAVSISSSTYLDRQLIWDRNGAWTDFTSAIGCASLLNHNGTPYWGSDDGYIYTMDIGENDDGNAIESWVWTKAYSMGSIIQQKTLDRIYVTADESGNWNLTLGYYLDRSLTATQSYTIDLDETADIINKKIAPSMQVPFYTLQYKLSNNNANEPWDLLGIQTFYRRLPLR